MVEWRSRELRRPATQSSLFAKGFAVIKKRQSVSDLVSIGSEAAIPAISNVLAGPCQRFKLVEGRKTDLYAMNCIFVRRAMRRCAGPQLLQSSWVEQRTVL